MSYLIMSDLVRYRIQPKQIANLSRADRRMKRAVLRAKNSLIDSFFEPKPNLTKNLSTGKVELQLTDAQVSRLVETGSEKRLFTALTHGVVVSDEGSYRSSDQTATAQMVLAKAYHDRFLSNGSSDPLEEIGISKELIVGAKFPLLMGLIAFCEVVLNPRISFSAAVLIGAVGSAAILVREHINHFRFNQYNGTRFLALTRNGNLSQEAEQILAEPFPGDSLVTKALNFARCAVIGASLTMGDVLGKSPPLIEQESESDNVQRLVWPIPKE